MFILVITEYNNLSNDCTEDNRMFELEKYDFFHTSRLFTGLLIFAGVVLLAGMFWLFMLKLGMTMAECKPLILMAILFVGVVAGAVVRE